MSIRANVIIKDVDSQLIFYRHSGGHPEGVAPSLNKFIELLRANKIRSNVSQSSGWLIILGAAERNTNRDWKDANYGKSLNTPISEFLPNDDKSGYMSIDWKVGAYEPTTGIHGDIEFLYEINLNAKTLEGWMHDGENKGVKVNIPGYEAPIVNVIC